MNHAIPEQRKKWGVVRGSAFVLNALPPAAALFVAGHLGSPVLSGSAILYIACLSAIARWKKWGVYGLAALYVVVAISVLIDNWSSGDLLMWLSTLLFWSVFPMLIFASVYSKWDQME